MDDHELLLLWGKTCREEDAEDFADRYHPLAFHLLDVAHCALALWDEVLSEKIKGRIAATLCCEQPRARFALAYLAGAHDVGKANPYFQFQPTPLDWLVAQIQAAGLTKPVDPQNKPHNFISTKELIPHFKGSGFWRADRYGACVLAHITGAHHGTFPSAQDYAAWEQNVTGNARWSAARSELLELLRKTLCANDFEFPFTDWPEIEIGSVPLLAGLISVADWLGSSHHFKPAAHRRQPVAIQDYRAESQAKAQLALREFGFRPTPLPTVDRPEFAAFWGFAPNALQRSVIEHTQDLTSPFFLLVEAPMGVGKTESALWASDAAQSIGLNCGFYIALPTQATSNAMHERVKKFLEKRLPDENAIHLQLVHSNAGLSESAKVVFQGLHPLWGIDAETGAREVERVVAASWFCGAKRPLLAPFGVGTIDQSLLGALQTRHWFVRLFALAGKVVIFDEVHAYDTYMGGILATLIGWLKELDCSVILLSATLPTSKRRELLAAWSGQKPKNEAPYPRLTMCLDGQTESIAVSPEELPQKTILITHFSTEELASTLREKLVQGGCAAIICNTVGEAQTLFSALKAELGDFCHDWTLFHARSPFGWRQETEEQILKKFGKKKEQRPFRSVVVATQVIEQSLDLDFDWMASFMAPSDLLLQRLGRLHRHERNEHDDLIVRPSGLETPQFAIIGDAAGDSVPSFGNSAYVYECEILLRSHLLWRDRKTLEIPGEIETIVEQTYSPALPDAPTEEWRKALEDAARKAEKTRRDAIQTAGNVVVNTRGANGQLRTPESICDAPNLDLRDEDDPRTHPQMRAATRNGDPSVRAVCLCGIGDKMYLPDDNGDADLNQEVDFFSKIEPETGRALMDFSVPLSQKTIFHALVDRKVPENWKKSPFLRHARPLIFRDGKCELGNHRVTLDRELGLVFEKISP